MATVLPFQCVRPSEEMAARIAALPYDVYSREEAKEVVERNPQSFLAIDRAETQLGDEVDPYAPEVYEKASGLLAQWMAGGALRRDPQDCYYVYEQTMNGRSQTGIVGCASIDDYLGGVIKKHENTLEEKEQDRIRHIDVCSAQTGPIFLAYRAHPEIRRVIALTKSDAEQTKLYDFVSEDGVRHVVYRIADPDEIEVVRAAFESMDSLYIADGHHRAASAVKVGLMRRQEHPDYDGTEQFNYFLSVLFPDEELLIMDYNRLVRDLGELGDEEFLKKVKRQFLVEKIAGASLLHQVESKQKLTERDIRPRGKGQFSMFFKGAWYRCQILPADIPEDPVDGLDVSILQNRLLGPVLGIEDPKTDHRIEFVGGIRGLKELEARCEDDCKVAFVMYPTSIHDMFAVADAGRMMPPKSTWFEPKLRSGLFIHEIER